MERFNSNISKEIGLTNFQASYFREINLWNSFDFNKFKFRLSSEKLVLSPMESKEIRLLSNLISAKDGFIQNAIKLYKMTLDPRFSGTILGGSIRKTLTTNISSVDLDFIDSDLDNAPFITRLDLVMAKNPMDGTPKFQIVEIEGDKTHAFGYVTFQKLIRNKFLFEENSLGIVEAFRTELEKRNIPNDEPIILILNRSESFYLKELKAFAEIAKMNGINLNIAEEGDIKIQDDQILVSSQKIKSKVLVNIPVLTPNGIYGTGFALNDFLKIYKEKKIQVLIPPYRFLGAKGLLGIFKNTLKDPELEKLLEKTFGKELLTSLRPFMPETINVTKRNKNKVLEILSNEPNEWVIKEISTSGMRGVSLPEGNEKEKRERMLAQIISNPFNFIIQRKVVQETRLFTFAEPENPSQIKQAEMYMRVSPFITNNGLIEVGLTAREKPSVHGAIDSIQIPVIY